MALAPMKLQDSAHYRTHYAAVVDAADNIDVVTNPAYWLHVASKLRRMDIIDILPEDESYYAELLVLATGIGFAKVMVLREVNLATPDEDSAHAMTEVKWSGPHAKWAVIRRKDRVVLQDKIPDKQAAISAAAQYERTIAA